MTDLERIIVGALILGALAWAVFLALFTNFG